jgi:hypothetical protein
MVCSPDARSLRLPGHLPEEKRVDQMVLVERAQFVPAQPPLLE